jgi:hypothetical protein
MEHIDGTGAALEAAQRLLKDAQDFSTALCSVAEEVVWQSQRVQHAGRYSKNRLAFDKMYFQALADATASMDSAFVAKVQAVGAAIDSLCKEVIRGEGPLCGLEALQAAMHELDSAVGYYYLPGPVTETACGWASRDDGGGSRAAPATDDSPK